MARRVFFSFHFERDIWRTGQVRNSWLLKENRESAGFWDAVKWEEVKRQGDDAIKRWINNSLEGTSITVILIGAETSNRDWVKYEIKRSYARGNGFLGIRIHNMKDRLGKTDAMGKNPLDQLYFTKDGRNVYLSEKYKTYDWVLDNGYNNLGNWIEESARIAGR